MSDPCKIQAYASFDSASKSNTHFMLTASPLTLNFGVEVSGIDLSPAPGQRTVAELLRLLDTHGAVLLRGQNLTPDSFLAFSRHLGELAAPPERHVAHANHLELTLLSNIIEHGTAIGIADSGSPWRMDGAHLKTPWRATALYAAEVPEHAGTPLGDTWLASSSAACDAMAPGLRDQLPGLRAVHIHGAGRKKRSTPFFPDSGLTQIFRKGVEHPVVRAHPVTGRKCLYVNRVSTSHLCGMNDSASDALLAQLYQHLDQPQFHYRHQWQAGDVLLWDNCATQHRAVTDYAWPQRRLLYRTLIKGLAAR